MPRFGLKYLVFAAASISVLAVASLAALPPAARVALDRAIADALENARSGSEVPWSSESGYGGHVTVDRAFSRSTGQVCTAGCNDPCRPVDYQVSSTESLTVFHGLRCRQVEDDGTVRWIVRGNDTITRHMTLVNGVDPNNISTNDTDDNQIAQNDTPARPHTIPATSKIKVQQPALGPKARKRLALQIQLKLSRLLYYSGAADGDFGEASRSALRAFLEDERSAVLPAPSEDVLRLLGLAEARIIRGTCSHPNGVAPSDTVACATVSG